MPLSESLSKENVTELFRNALKKDRLSLAYLFTGEAEQDKKDAAIELARILNCRASIDGNCKCDNCRRIVSLGYPDVIWIKASGNPPSIKIEQIRELKRKIILKPYEASKKIFIIDEADRMSESSQNALLKTLEEPPLDSILILISSNTRNLLKTILSRCKIIKFNKKEDPLHQLQRCEIIDNFLLIEKQNIEQLFDCQTREEFLAIIEALLSLFRDILILKSKADKSLLLNRKREDKISILVDSYTFEDLQKIITFLGSMCQYVKFNLNLKNCIMNTVIMLKETMKVEVL